MRQQKGEIVLNGLVLLVDPDLLAKNDDSAGTAKTSLIVGLLAKLAPPSHGEILSQVMPIIQHLILILLAGVEPRMPAFSSFVRLHDVSPGVGREALGGVLQ